MINGYLLISVGGYTTGHSFATGYSKTADHYTAKRGDWYSGRQGLKWGRVSRVGDPALI